MWSLLSNIGAAIAFVVFIGAAVVYVRGSRDKGTIASQASLLTALKDELAHEKGERQKLEVRVAALESENENLRAQRPSAEVLKQISDDVDSMRVELHRHDLEVKSVAKVIKEWRQR